MTTKKKRREHKVRTVSNFTFGLIALAPLTVNGDVDAAGLDSPDGTRDEEADLTGETSVLVLLGDFVLQRTLHGVEATGLPHHQGQHVYIWSSNRGAKPHQRNFQGPKLQELGVKQTTCPINLSHLRPGVDIRGRLFLYQVMLGLGKPLPTSHDATWKSHTDTFLLSKLS